MIAPLRSSIRTLLLGCVAGVAISDVANAEEKPPEPLPKELTAAWVKAGAKVILADGKKASTSAAPHAIGMADALIADEAFDPVDVGLFGSQGIMLNPSDLSNAVEEFHVAPQLV